MRIRQKSSAGHASLKRVAQGLDRYSTSGVYFAHLRIHGKLFRESLETTDRATAVRKLGDFRRSKLKVDSRPQQDDRHGPLRPVRSHAQPFIKKHRHRQARNHRAPEICWPEGAEHSAGAIKPSHCETWLGRQAKRVGRSHYNAYVQLLREVLDFAVRDQIIPENPAAHLKYLKRERPIRLTPSWDEFQAIVADIRKQPFNADAKDSGDL